MQTSNWKRLLKILDTTHGVCDKVFKFNSQSLNSHLCQTKLRMWWCPAYTWCSPGMEVRGKSTLLQVFFMTSGNTLFSPTPQESPHHSPTAGEISQGDRCCSLTWPCAAWALWCYSQSSHCTHRRQPCIPAREHSKHPCWLPALPQPWELVHPHHQELCWEQLRPGGWLLPPSWGSHTAHQPQVKEMLFQHWGPSRSIQKEILGEENKTGLSGESKHLPMVLDSLTFLWRSPEDGEHLWNPACSHPGAKVAVGMQTQAARKEAGWFCRTCIRRVLKQENSHACSPQKDWASL